MLPTLDEFLIQKFPLNSYIRHPDFIELYVRKGPVGVSVDRVFYRCHNTITIARVVAVNPGNGAFTKLIDDLTQKDLAIYIESVCNIRFAIKLEKLGFKSVKSVGLNYLKNEENHLVPWNV